MDESQSEAIVEINGSSFSNLMTKHDAALLKAEIKGEVSGVKADVYRVSWIQGIGIVAIVGTIIAISTALG